MTEIKYIIFIVTIVCVIDWLCIRDYNNNNKTLIILKIIIISLHAIIVNERYTVLRAPVLHNKERKYNNDINNADREW